VNINDHRDAIAQALHDADMNGCTDSWPCDIAAYYHNRADALLASPALARLLAAARDEARGEALREARDVLYRGEGPDLVADSDIVYGEWLGNRADQIGGAA